MTKQKNTGFSVISPHSKGKGKEYVGSILCNGMHVERNSSNKAACQAWLNAFVALVNNYIISDNISLTEAFVRAKDFLKEDINNYKNVVVNLPFTVDIYQLSFPFDERPSNKNAERLKRIPQKETGQYTYVIENPSNGEYKIGKTNNLYRRFVTLSSAIYRMIMYTDRDIESILHKLFKEKRIRNNNEWFSLNNDDLEMLMDVYEFKKL